MLGELVEQLPLCLVCRKVADQLGFGNLHPELFQVHLRVVH
jgi:hypothetical protein